jgi:hypothetical protein
MGQANSLSTLIALGHMSQQLGRPNVAHLHPEHGTLVANGVSSIRQH